jgi:hypothetical protein
MKTRLRLIFEWTLLASMIGGAGFAVARAQPLDEAPQYVQFEPIIVPVFIDNRSAGLLSVHLFIEASSGEQRAMLESRRPRLIDAYTDALIRHARIHIDPLVPVDVSGLNAAIEAATQTEVTGASPRVLIVEAMAQPA